MSLDNINLYRITHIDNLPHILTHGITGKNSVNANPNFISIGDASLIATRAGKSVHVTDGNSFGIFPTIILGDYIPFYFGVRMPMLYVIQNGGNFVNNATPPQNIIYLVCSLQFIINLGITYYFCDGHATDSFTTFYSSAKIIDLQQIIDWDAVKEPYWGGDGNLNIKRKKQAEFLVLEDIVPSCLVGYVCYNEQAKSRLLVYGIREDKIKIMPNCYY